MLRVPALAAQVLPALTGARSTKVERERGVQRLVQAARARATPRHLTLNASYLIRAPREGARGGSLGGLAAAARSRRPKCSDCFSRGGGGGRPRGGGTRGAAPREGGGGPPSLPLGPRRVASQSALRLLRLLSSRARQRAGEARSSHPMPSFTLEKCDDRCESLSIFFAGRIG